MSDRTLVASAGPAHREAMRRAGGHWERESCGWRFASVAAADAARALLPSPGARAFPESYSERAKRSWVARRVRKVP